MENKFTLKLPENIVLKAKAAGITLCCPEENEMILSLHENCIPDIHGVCIGHVDKDTDILVSNIKGDDAADELRRYIDEGLVTTKIFCQIPEGTKELKNVPYYFVVYDVMESSAQRATYTEESSGNGTPLNGHYECEYEILLGVDEYTRRMVFKQKTVNISMYDWLQNLVDELESGNEYIGEHFYKDEDDNVYYTMFDEVGISTEVEFNPDEFASMIVSVRQISCEMVDDDEE